MDKPNDIERVGRCKKCGKYLYYSETEPNNEHSNVGDYDFVCYPCEFDMIENKTWENFVEVSILQKHSKRNMPH